MSDRGFEGFDKMSVEFVNHAKWMSDAILKAAYRGPGDTVDGAMHRAERLYGAPAKWLHRLRYRAITDMPVSAYAALLKAYHAAVEASEKKYRHERDLANARHSALLGIADFVAGATSTEEVRSVAEIQATGDAGWKPNYGARDKDEEG